MDDYWHKSKQGFFKAVVVSVLLYSCTTWTLTEHPGKKAQWKLLKCAGCCFQQILEKAPFKTAVLRPLTSHQTNNPNYTTRGKWMSLYLYVQTHSFNGPLINHPSKIYWILLEKQGRTYKQRSPVWTVDTCLQDLKKYDGR